MELQIGKDCKVHEWARQVSSLTHFTLVSLDSQLSVSRREMYKDVLITETSAGTSCTSMSVGGSRHHCPFQNKSAYHTVLHLWRKSNGMPSYLAVEIGLSVNEGYWKLHFQSARSLGRTLHKVSECRGSCDWYEWTCVQSTYRIQSIADYHATEAVIKDLHGPDGAHSK